MGGGCSQNAPGYDETYALGLYETSLQSTCVLPDIGIDESLLKYAGISSNAELQAYSNELVSSVPGFVEKLSTGLGALTSISNAVGLGAIVISMIMEIYIKSSTEASPDTYSIIQRVFGEEKASAVRDTMSEYLKRHRLFISNDQRLLEELKRLEAQLSGHLTSLRHSLLDDNQMSTRGFKIWVNGASFHIQMLIHEARLKIQAGEEEASGLVGTIETAIGLYLRSLEHLLEKYKIYKISTTLLQPHRELSCVSDACGVAVSNCDIKDTEKNCMIHHQHPKVAICNGCDMTKAYVNYIFSRHEPITSLRSHFSSMKDNVYSLVSQHDAFTLPSAT